VSVNTVDKAGCHGPNSVDDEAVDAVLLSLTVPDRPELLRWTAPTR
jgi:hypothetical protein